ncbi:RagB/SusD family nutrient uptake outer membrane protein [Parabacteroides sp. PF5-9]|uniref:RagB/SusD family nutrient uptake outer membrane protein n=1 Tax=Parabacteroides sp. PF5-9 TaxID=1742404 RepID=UPI002473BD69|nr:RagB/SusD family nutrient uptake outer membrane protein [Parabacteroides sp. PF5-9]MDH6357100.1 hypothetical protein [Parabacteroides sp. PF5-9]
MKKIYLVAAVIVGLTMGACSDFLEVDPVGKKSEKDYYSQTGIDQVLVGVYARFFTGNSFANVVTNYVYGDVMAGDANKGSNFADQPDFTSLELYAITTGNSYLNSKWERCYDGVFRANTVESVCNKTKDQLDATYYAHATGQAAFFRAYYHFEIVKVFGAAVPYVGVADYEANVNPQVSNVDEGGNYVYIWDKIAADFQYAYDNLPSDWTHNGEFGRVNKWAAAAFLAKLRMYQSSPYNGTNGGSNKWAEVKTILENVMANGVDPKGTKYQLAKTYEELYTAGVSDWTGESVFDVQNSLSGSSDRNSTVAGGAAVGMSGALGNSGWGFLQPSYDLVNAHIVDENGLPLMDGSFRKKAPITSSAPEIANEPETDLTVFVDPRVDYTVGRYGTPFLDWTVLTKTDGWIREPSNGGYYIHKKLIPKKADNGSLSLSTSAASTTKNFHLVRYADVLLWYAEALIETGEHTKAGEYINKVRARAANSFVEATDADLVPATSPYKLEDKVNGKTIDNAAGNYRIGLYPASQFASKEKATEALRFERRIELATEGHRWYDLTRWGIARTEINNFVEFEKNHLNKYTGAESYQDKWVTLPIPWNQLNKMQDLLVQNENWK